MHRITLIKGDGIGPEVIDCTLRVLEAAKVEIEWEEIKVGEEALKEYGTPLPDEAIESIKKNKVCLKGPVTTPIGEGFESVNVQLRKRLSLFAGVRPAKSILSPEDVDIVVIRENTEDLYSGIEFFAQEGDVAESVRIITRKASERIAHFAFQYALKHGRKKITIVHKANILKATCGLFLKVVKEVSSFYPEIECEDRLVDNMAMQLIRKAKEYDVLLCTNLFGDILSDLCAGLVGGLGVCPAANIGENLAVFEPVHGSAPKYAGKDRANPVATMLSACMMLHHIGEEEKASIIENAIKETIRRRECLTPDLGGTSSASSFTSYIIKKIR